MGSVNENGTIILDTPAEISMWVLLSRRQQIKLHLGGLKVAGLLTCLKREFGDHGRLVKNYVLPVEQAILAAGGETKGVQIILMSRRMGMWFDRGVYATMADAAVAAQALATPDDTSDDWNVQVTDQPVREENNEIYLTH